jgi:hypothetical protein
MGDAGSTMIAYAQKWCLIWRSLVGGGMLKILSGQFPLLEKRNERCQDLQ